MTNFQIIADYIREHGWCQGEFHSSDGRVCLAGAIETTGFGGKTYREVLEKINRTTDPDYPHGYSCISDWNDVPGRTVEEVLAILEPG
jgi:hypothetical protein